MEERPLPRGCTSESFVAALGLTVPLMLLTTADEIIE
jgi:hypothetical protein